MSKRFSFRDTFDASDLPTAPAAQPDRLLRASFHKYLDQAGAPAGITGGKLVATLPASAFVVEETDLNEGAEDEMPAPEFRLYQFGPGASGAEHDPADLDAALKHLGAQRADPRRDAEPVQGAGAGRGKLVAILDGRRFGIEEDGEVLRVTDDAQATDPATDPYGTMEARKHLAHHGTLRGSGLVEDARARAARLLGRAGGRGLVR